MLKCLHGNLCINASHSLIDGYWQLLNIVQSCQHVVRNVQKKEKDNNINMVVKIKNMITYKASINTTLKHKNVYFQQL